MVIGPHWLDQNGAPSVQPRHVGQQPLGIIVLGVCQLAQDVDRIQPDFGQRGLDALQPLTARQAVIQHVQRIFQDAPDGVELVERRKGILEYSLHLHASGRNGLGTIQ